MTPPYTDTIAMMNKKQASEYLGVSTKAIERYTKAGKLTPTYQRKPRGGTEAAYDDEQVKQLKTTMETAKAAPAQIEHRRERTGRDSQSLVWVSKLTDLAHELLATIQAARAAVPIANKLTLTLPQAAELAGVPETVLAGAIQKSELPARTIEGVVMVRRSDIEVFIDRLWRTREAKPAKAKPALAKPGRAGHKKHAVRKK